MSNQSKWLIAAYSLFYAGGVLVPLDFKLTAAEHLQLLAHASVKVLIVEFPFWLAITQSPAYTGIYHSPSPRDRGPQGCEISGRTALGRVHSCRSKPPLRAKNPAGPGLYRLLLRYRWAAQGMHVDSRQLPRAVPSP